MGLLLASLAGFLPMLFFAWFLYYLDRYEKEPIRLLAGMFTWGAVVAAGTAYLVNSVSSLSLLLITQSEPVAQLLVSTLVAPVGEELLKGAAILLLYLTFQSEFDSPLDGLIYGGVTALGFAATENIWYIYRLGYLENGWQGLLDLTLIRVVLVGWQHPFYTAFTGLGFALARQSPKQSWKWLAPLAGLAAAMVFHLLHNLLAILLGTGQLIYLATVWDWSGYLGLLGLAVFLINREQRWMREFLLPELRDDLISLEQYRTACSPWKRGASLLKALFQGNYLPVRNFYHACGDLMHKRRQLVRLKEPENAPEIERLRSQISAFSARI